MSFGVASLLMYISYTMFGIMIMNVEMTEYDAYAFLFVYITMYCIIICCIHSMRKENNENEQNAYELIKMNKQLNDDNLKKTATINNLRQLYYDQRDECDDVLNKYNGLRKHNVKYSRCSKGLIHWDQITFNDSRRLILAYKKGYDIPYSIEIIGHGLCNKYVMESEEVVM